MRLLLLAAVLASGLPAATAPEPQPNFVQAVEFPYYLYPRNLWERELVWLKTIGIRTVAFSIPWNWHRVEPENYDFTGRTSPRRDLVAFVRLLRRLGLKAWLRPLPPVKNWLNGGYPPGEEKDRRAARAWLDQVTRLLEPQLTGHGGPVAFVEGAPGALDAPPPPLPITVLSANDPRVLAHSRRALAAGHGSLLWEDVESGLYPAGWEPGGASLLRHGAISFTGEEHPPTAALRRDAALLRDWSRLIPAMRPRPKPGVRPADGAFPAGVSAAQLVSAEASGISMVNQSAQTFRGDLRAWDPVAGHELVLTGVQLPPQEALWLPVSVSLAGGGLCQDCAGLASPERILYATSELLAVEFENGILAMEFAAPVPGEVVLELSRQPSGPFLAAGSPTKFDFDEKSMRARLPIPAGKGAGHRVRIGLAIEPPEQSAFFVDARRLIIGRKNVVSTSYSSARLAGRTRLRLPEGFTAKAVPKSATEIDYDIDVPADALHGDWANLAIEADGVLLGRARLQMFRPASIYLEQAIRLHFGQEELPVEPPIAAIEPQAGRNLDIRIRNNSMDIQTYAVESAGAGFQFFPAKSEISIGAVMERLLPVRVFSEEEEEGAGPRPWNLKVSGGAAVEVPLRLVTVPRGRAVAYAADLDGDGSPEWVLENQRVRATFSTRDGGRWLEFVWKDTGANVLPEAGLLAGVGPVVVEARTAGAATALNVVFGQGRRTVTLSGAEGQLTVEQNVPLPPSLPLSEKRNGLSLEVRRESSGRAVFILSQ